MGAVIIDGTGTGSPVKVTNNRLWVDNVPSGLTAIVGSVAITNASINVDVTVADYVSVTPSGTFYSTVTNSGTALTVIGSTHVTQSTSPWVVLGSAHVTQSTSPWVVLGSVNVDNAVSVGSLATQGVIGSVNIDNAVSVGSLATQGVIGSVNIDNAVSVGSLATQTIIGSVAITNSSLNVDVTVSDYLSVTPSGIFFATVTNSGTAVSVIGSTHVTQSTSPWVTVGSVNIDNAVTVGSLATQGIIGSVNIDNAVSVGSLATQGVIGSVNIDNAASVGSLATQTIIGSVAITNSSLNVDVTVSDYLSVTPSGIFFATVTNSGTALGIIGSVNIDNAVSVGSLATQGVIGSVNIDNASAVGSLATQTIIGSVAITNSSLNVDVTVSDYLSVTPSGIFYSTVTNSGTALGIIGSVNIDNASAVGSLATQTIIGSVHVTQSTSPWVILGSTHVTQSTSPWVTIGSVNIDNASAVGSLATQTITYPTAGFDFSGATIAGSVTAQNIYTPGAGSCIELRAFTISSSVPQKVALLFSGGTAIASYRIPGSGTVAMNLLGAAVSGAADKPLALAADVAGSVDVTVFVRSLKP